MEIITRFTIMVACSEDLLDYVGAEYMELDVRLTREQAEQLLDEPETELIVYYPDGSKVIVRIDNTAANENRTVH